MEKLTEEQLGELVQKAKTSGMEEAKFLLEISEWQRPGPSFEDSGKFEILYGDVEQIEVKHEYNYPTTDEHKYILIPKTKIVVILHHSENDYEDGIEEQNTLYVFSYPEGWRSLQL